MMTISDFALQLLRTFAPRVHVNFGLRFCKQLIFCEHFCRQLETLSLLQKDHG